MTRDQAIEFLREHQPMPDDADLDDATAETYDEVREYFEANPDPECVSLFIGSFGDGLGFGVYQLVERTLARHPQDIVISAINNGLQSRFPGVQYWSANLAVAFPDDCFLCPLLANLKSGNPNTKSMALGALASLATNLRSERARNAVLEFFDHETDEDLKSIAADVVEYIESFPGGE